MNAGENKSFRAGRYVQQPAGYRAFLPAPLPPDPPVALGGTLRELLSDADYALGRLDGAVLTLPRAIASWTTCARVREWLDVTPAGANNLVNRLVDIGLLREITGSARNRRVRVDPYLKLFEEPGEVGK